ncbi:hypothetical protein Hanom_Chr00s000002g01599791 [Helianthus anomalus]
MFILYVFITIYGTFVVQSLKFLSFLFIIDCLWLESPVSLFFTEPRLKSDLFGLIIWYQSLGGSFKFLVRSDLYQKTRRRRKTIADLYLNDVSDLTSLLVHPSIVFIHKSDILVET